MNDNRSAVYSFPSSDPPVRQQNRRRRWRFKPSLALFFIVPLVILGSLAVNMIGLIGLRIRLGRESTELHRQLEQVNALNKELKQEVAWRKSDAYLEQEARKFGMAPADEVQYRFAVPEPPGSKTVKRVKKPVIHD